MGAYVVRRTLLAVLTIWVVSLFSWVLIQIPEGDYADSYMKIMTEWSVKTDWTPEEEEELRERFGLNRPDYGAVLGLDVCDDRSRRVWPVLYGEQADWRPHRRDATVHCRRSPPSR